MNRYEPAPANRQTWKECLADEKATAERAYEWAAGHWDAWIDATQAGYVTLGAAFVLNPAMATNKRNLFLSNAARRDGPRTGGAAIELAATILDTQTGKVKR